jgi:hypothetical protein
MQKQIHLLLGDNEIFQLLDGLQIREEAWLKTAKYLETEELPDDEFFLIEECSDAREARNIAKDYRTIIDKIEKQQATQQSNANVQASLQPPKKGRQKGYAIYINTFFRGPVAIERDENEKPVAYPTERAAQCEVVDLAIIRLQQFLAGQRDYEDATHIEEYIVPVDLDPDGSITDQNGKTFPNPNW